MAKRKKTAGTKTYSVSIEFDPDPKQIAGWLESGQRRFLERSGDRLAAAVAERAPGGATGSVGRATRFRSLSSTTGEIVVDHPGGKALARGAYIKPRGQALRFRDGSFVRRAVRLPKTDFDKRGLASRRRIIARTYQETFSDLSRNEGTVGGID